jgi:hypothetical protein
METYTYGDINDVINQYVCPALGDFAEDFDVEAIARTISRYDEGQGCLVVEEDGETEMLLISGDWVYWQDVCEANDISGRS